MHCPHCQGEIPPNSQFCGICGTSIESSSLTNSKVSLFAIPVSRGAKKLRIALIVGLNVAMFGAGIWLALGYLNKRELAAAPLTLQTDTVSASLRDSPTPPLPLEASDQAGVRTNQQVQNKSGTGKGGANGSGNSTQRGSSKQGDTSPTTSTDTSPTTTDTSPTTTDASPTTGTDTTKPDESVSNGDTPRVVLDAGSLLAPDAKVGGQSGGSGGTAKVDAGAKKPDTAAVLTAEEEEKRVQIVASKVSRIVASHSGQLGRCYQNAQKITTPDQPIEGVVKVQFAIQSDGSSKSVRVSSNSTTSPSLAKCVAGLVRGWSFPQTPGPDMDFEWPFEFQAPK